MPFDDRGPIKKKGLKITNEKSSVKPPPPDPVAAFNEQARQAHSKYEEYKQRTWELGSKFKAMVEDKILNVNKSVLSKGIETETLNKLVALASEMNEDDNQPESIGSTALAHLVMKMMLVQRDTINGLLFRLDKLEQANAKLEVLVKSLESKEK